MLLSSRDKEFFASLYSINLHFSERSSSQTLLFTVLAEYLRTYRIRYIRHTHSRYARLAERQRSSLNIHFSIHATRSPFIEICLARSMPLVTLLLCLPMLISSFSDISKQLICNLSCFSLYEKIIAKYFPSIATKINETYFCLLRRRVNF